MAVGTFGDGSEAAEMRSHLGVQYMEVGYDTRMLSQGLRATVTALRRRMG